MDIKCAKLAKMLGITVFTLDIYMCREEFAHIVKMNNPVKMQEKIYTNLRDGDVKNLKKFVKNRTLYKKTKKYIENN